MLTDHISLWLSNIVVCYTYLFVMTYYLVLHVTHYRVDKQIMLEHY
nr:MAG TPA: hypothetical protein [Caudoviricetes sp.]